MGRIVTTSILFVVFSILGAVGAPAALAGTHISGVIAGERVLPDSAEHLRYIQRWKQWAEETYRIAQAHRDWQTMETLRADYAQAERDERQVRRDLRAARTRVTVYGDAAQYMTEQKIVNLLLNTGAWKLGSVHIWQRGGRLQWGRSAPVGYDNKRGGRGSSSTSGGKGNYNGGPYGVRPPRGNARPVPFVAVPPSALPKSGGSTSIYGLP